MSKREARRAPPADRLPSAAVDGLTRGDDAASDSVHQLTMDLHKELNRLQAMIADEVIDGAHVATLDETAEAIRVLAERVRVIAEGAGALSTAAALSGRTGGRTIACIVSGGNIDASTLARILGGETPR